VQTPSLQPDERAALTAVLAYWQEHWDWECPTLFGLELTEYQAAVSMWRERGDPSLPQVACALLGALREFLYGASAVGVTDFTGLTGMSRPDLLALENRVGPYVLGIVEQGRTV
jgi:hypothetical protein